MEIKVSSDFSDSPGARHYEDGDNSGQEFYEKILRDAFVSCVKSGELLYMDLDDVYGYASSFLSESFGRLASEYGSDVVLERIVFKSEDSPLLVDKIKRIIRDARYSSEA